METGEAEHGMGDKTWAGRQTGREADRRKEDMTGTGRGWELCLLSPL